MRPISINHSLDLLDPDVEHGSLDLKAFYQYNQASYRYRYKFLESNYNVIDRPFLLVISNLAIMFISCYNVHFLL